MTKKYQNGQRISKGTSKRVTKLTTLLTHETRPPRLVAVDLLYGILYISPRSRRSI